MSTQDSSALMLPDITTTRADGIEKGSFVTQGMQSHRIINSLC